MEHQVTDVTKQFTVDGQLCGKRLGGSRRHHDVEFSVEDACRGADSMDGTLECLSLIHI